VEDHSRLIYPRVAVGEGAVWGPFVVIGEPPRGVAPVVVHDVPDGVVVVGNPARVIKRVRAIAAYKS